MEAIILRQSIIGVSIPIVTGVMIAGATFTIGPGGMNPIGGTLRRRMVTTEPGISSVGEENSHPRVRKDSSGVVSLSPKRS